VRKGFLKMSAAVFLAALVIVLGCEARKTHEELIEFGTKLESSRPLKEKIEENFNSLREHKVESQEDFNELGKKIAQLILDIEEMIKPIERMEPDTEEVQKLRGEYLEMWTSLRDALRLTLLAMATPDKQKSTRIMEKVMRKNSDYSAALQKFGTDYSTIMNRYGIKKEELGIGPQDAPVSPSPQAESIPPQ